jgi:malonyl-CoA O-methyltransferase
MTAPQIDVPAARRRFERAAPTYAEVSVLAREVEARMAERLQYVRHEPKLILDAGCGPGEGLRLLRRHYPKAQLLGVDNAWSMARAARRAPSLVERAKSILSGAASHHACADLARLPLGASSVGMIWSNLALAWAQEPPAALAEFARVLEPGGLLMFSTYGPDTLKELRDASAQLDAYAHVHRFVDMHDLGDMLGAAGFGQPVMDIDVVTLDYSDVDAIARDLRLSGQSNIDAGRRRGLMTPRAWARMVSAYEVRRRRGKLPATFEIIYGHAWRAQPRGQQVVNVSFPQKTKK